MRVSTVLAPKERGLNLGNSDRPQNGDLDGKKYRESGRKFDVKTLPADLHRVYKRMRAKFGEEYALTLVFVIRTAVELHRAWHMTLLTSRLLVQLKEKFDLRMTWNLGVTNLVFRIEDGLYELHRRIPYDYDSEFQDRYEKIAVALLEEDIGIHDALIVQSETKKGYHTSRNGLFLRDTPGRLILYPFQAATVCVIFFNGDWHDCWAAAICGLTAGFIEWMLSSERIFANVGESKLLIDFFVGLSTGLIGGVCYSFLPFGSDFCLSSIFLGTLYWFFYGTAFVIGLLEIISGELETGCIRFLSVSIKTFVLSVASAVGLSLIMFSTEYDVYEVWTGQFIDGRCENDIEADTWWRIPFYILCSISVLGQYRFIVSLYWVGLVVQVAGYEVQYRFAQLVAPQNRQDGMDTVISNIMGAIAATVVACYLCLLLEFVRSSTTARVYQTNKEETLSTCGRIMQSAYGLWIDVSARLGITTGLPRQVAEVRQKLQNESNPQLSEKEEAILVAGSIAMQEANVWSFLMPAVYQLVPGSKIAMFWYNIIFPPPLDADDPNADDSLSALMLISVSLALGLILGLAVVRVITNAVFQVTNCCRGSNSDDVRQKFQHQRGGVSHKNFDLDPDDNDDAEWEREFEKVWENSEELSSTNEVEDDEKDNAVISKGKTNHSVVRFKEIEC